MERLLSYKIKNTFSKVFVSLQRLNIIDICLILICASYRKNTHTRGCRRKQQRQLGACVEGSSETGLPVRPSQTRMALNLMDSRPVDGVIVWRDGSRLAAPLAGGLVGLGRFQWSPHKIFSGKWPASDLSRTLTAGATFFPTQQRDSLTLAEVDGPRRRAPQGDDG
jgi:hypothetical protein